MSEELEEICEHDWKFVKDWEGDCDVPNGTRDCSYFYCPLCDTEQVDQPDDFEEPFNEPDPPDDNAFFECDGPY